MPELTLDTRTVAWGHSQGGQSALWTGIVGPRYAPDVQIVGVAAIAPAANMANILAMSLSDDKRLGPCSRFYPNIEFDPAVRSEALQAARQMINLCGFFPPQGAQRLVALTATFEGRALATSTNPALAARLAQNTADHPIDAPLVIAQGLAVDPVPPAATDAYVDERCAAGQRLEYWKFAGRDHGGIVRPGSSLDEPLVAWTVARFANEPQASGCVRRSF